MTQQYVHGPTASNGQTGDTVTMVDEFTNKGTTITTPIVVVPLAAQLKQVGTPTVTVDGKAVTAQVVPMSGYFNIAWAGPIAKGSQVVVSYQVQATAALPASGLTPTDVMMDQSSYVVDTNKVTLLPAATTGGIEITPPTNLEFGTQTTTPGTYKNTDGDKTLLVTDNRGTPGPWTITAQLSDFTAGSRKLTGEAAKINFGTPALSSAIFTAGGPANQLVSYDYADKQTSMSYVFKNIQLQLAGNNIQPGDYHATITYSWTDGVN
ncbi:WxL domain-containing protein [Paucilactobacillus nenjiangensis]|uniref:WxL domain-containing protein n=1 Tax=Paucilactobacillus nenjiangensis TaxID=1296540 RepID=UPI003BAE25D4